MVRAFFRPYSDGSTPILRAVVLHQVDDASLARGGGRNPDTTGDLAPLFMMTAYDWLS